MSKIITRTIKFYIYTTGKVDLVRGVVNEVQRHTYTSKLGERDRRNLERSVGNPIIKEEVEKKLYGISIESFVEYGHQVSENTEEVEDNE